MPNIRYALTDYLKVFAELFSKSDQKKSFMAIVTKKSKNAITIYLLNLCVK